MADLINQPPKSDPMQGRLIQTGRSAPRCAECDCADGGADCNWIAQPTSEPKEGG